MLLSRDGDAVSTARFGSSTIKESVLATLTLRPPGMVVQCSAVSAILAFPTKLTNRLFCSPLQGGGQKKGTRCGARIERCVEPQSVLHRFLMSHH